MNISLYTVAPPAAVRHEKASLHPPDKVSICTGLLKSHTKSACSLDFAPLINPGYRSFYSIPGASNYLYAIRLAEIDRMLTPGPEDDQALHCHLEMEWLADC